MNTPRRKSSIYPVALAAVSLLATGLRAQLYVPAEEAPTYAAVLPSPSTLPAFTPVAATTQATMQLGRGRAQTEVTKHGAAPTQLNNSASNAVLPTSALIELATEPATPTAGFAVQEIIAPSSAFLATADTGPSLRLAQIQFRE